MEVLRVDPSLGVLSLQQEQEKAAIRQALGLVSLLRAQTEDLVSEYLSHQGPPFSAPGFSYPRPQIDGLPTLDAVVLLSNPWKRLALSLSAFGSLSGWFAVVLRWQKELNPRAHQLHTRLEVCRQDLRALRSNLGSILGKLDLSSSPTSMAPKAFKQKLTGYTICWSYREWLFQTERDLMIMAAETAV
ncbi:hypothetical protein FKM82_022857 [Ascaphus truei]